MTPTQTQWRELQRQVHLLQAKSSTEEEMRQLAEVLLLIESHLYLAAAEIDKE